MAVIFDLQNGERKIKLTTNISVYTYHRFPIKSSNSICLRYQGLSWNNFQTRKKISAIFDFQIGRLKS